jgi:hypothetical protein
MATDDWSAFEDKLERRLRKTSKQRDAYRQSGKSVFMLKQLMGRSTKTATKPKKRRK